MCEGTPIWVSVPPDIIKLMLCLHNPEAIIIAGHAGSSCSCWVYNIQLICDAVEVAAKKELPLGWKAGQQVLDEEGCPVCCCAGCIDAGDRKFSVSKGEVHAEYAAVGRLMPVGDVCCVCSVSE